MIKGQPALRRQIAAVVVTFHPSDQTLRLLLQAVKPQTEAIVIVDNTPGGADLSDLVPPNVALIRNGVNVGLATAQNIGIRWAEERGFTHIFMLDQDSLPDQDCVQRLYETACDLSSKGLAVAVVGPCVLDHRTGRAYSFKRFTWTGIEHRYCSEDVTAIAADFVIASGSLTAIETLRAVGPMDEGLFIDRIDIDWCLRAATLGFGIYGICSARMRHEPGEHSRRIWLGRWTEAAVHSPVRTYYMIRNSILLYRRPHAPLRWIFNDVLWLIGVVLISCAVAPNRVRRLSLVCKAIWDGMRRVQGPLNEKNAGLAGQSL